MNKIINQPLRETPDIDSSTDDYAKRFKGKVGEWLLKVQMDATMEHLRNSKETTILDVGGGHGQTLETLLNNDYKVVVYGSSKSCFERILKFSNHINSSFISGNLIKLPFKDNSFDIVISYRMLTHLNNWQCFIKELTRVSKKTVIVDFPAKRSVNFLADALFSLKKKIEKNTRSYHVFNEKDIVHNFEENNFIPAKKIPQFFFPMALHRFLKNIHLSKFIENLTRKTSLTFNFGSPIIYKFKSK